MNYLFKCLADFFLIMRSGTGRNFRRSQIAHFMYNIFFSENRAAYDNVKKYGRARQAADNTTVLCKPDNWGCRHTLSICNTYCFSTAMIVTRKHLSVLFTRTLPVYLLPNQSYLVILDLIVLTIFGEEH